MKTLGLNVFGLVMAMAMTLGCNKSGSDEAPVVKKDDSTATAADKAPAKTNPVVANGANPPAGGAAAKPMADEGGIKGVPTLQEWNAVTTEVTVKGSTALGCETKMVREWLRISCRGKNDTGGTPTTVSLTSGNRPGQIFTFASGGVTSIVMKFTSGVNAEAVFSWTDKSHKLVSQWSAGAPEPPIKAVFEGASSPLDPPKNGTVDVDQACRTGPECKSGLNCCMYEWGGLCQGYCGPGARILENK